MSGQTRKAPIRVMLLGHQPIMLAGLGLLLDRAADLSVVAQPDVGPTTDDGDSLGPLPSFTARAKNPDVIIIDIDGGMGRLLPVLAPAVPRGTRMMILASALEQQTLALAFRQGVTGAIRKDDAPDVLLEAVRQVHRGQVWLDQSSTTELVTRLSETPHTSTPEAQRATSLTARERQVVALAGEGLRNLEMADRLSISEVTVRNHLTAIFRKLKLSNRFQLALYAFKHGLSKLPATFGARRPASRARTTRTRSAS